MRRSKLRLLVLAGICALPALSKQGLSGATDAGQQPYNDYQCWQCHGYEGQGGAAPRIAPTVYSFEAFARFVRYTNVMPAYSPNVLSDDTLRQIYEFVRTRPEPPPLADLPALRDL